MRHLIEWQEKAINAVPEERATVADLRLWLNGQNVTTHIFEDTLGDHVTIALFGLINGLVHDWWTIFGSRDREFSLQRYRCGYLLPDVRIHFDGAVFEVSAHEAAYLDPNVRFLSGTRQVLSRDEGEAWLDSLIQETLQRLERSGIRGSSAALRWERVQSSRRSDERYFCEAAGGLGLDPYAIGNDLADAIEIAEGIFEDEPLVEFVGGSGEVDHLRLVKWVEKMVGIKGGQYRLSNLRPLVDQIDADVPNRLDESAWAAGYRRARAMRKALGVRQGQKFCGFRDLANKFGASKQFNLAPKVNGINALRRESADGIHIHIRNHGEQEAAGPVHLFALARAIGDAACFPAEQNAPINRLHRAYRQSAGRAFAAEFLAPIDEIRSMMEDEKDEYTIANAFGVAPAVVSHQLENQGRIAQVFA